MTVDALERLVALVRDGRSTDDLLGPDSPLLLERVIWKGRTLDVHYAPFEHLETNARVVVLGLTPGRRQAEDALESFAEALRSGHAPAAALRTAKAHASFAGPMRRNLVRMLDAIGVARLVGVDSTAELWDEDAGLAHFTSLVRNPVFVDGTNWSGTPDPVTTPALRRWMEAWTGPELSSLAPAVFVPLGPAVARGLGHLASIGMLPLERILSGLPHPSGANAERVACFVGDKHPALASAKTDGHALVAARERLSGRVAHLTSGRLQPTPIPANGRLTSFAQEGGR